MYTISTGKSHKTAQTTIIQQTNRALALDLLGITTKVLALNQGSNQRENAVVPDCSTSTIESDDWLGKLPSSVNM